MSAQTQHTQEASGKWSAPFHGVTHLGRLADHRRATVTDRGSFAELTCWYPGCGFNPIQTQHDDAATAKAAGERYVATGAAA